MQSRRILDVKNAQQHHGRRSIFQEYADSQAINCEAFEVNRGCKSELAVPSCDIRLLCSILCPIKIRESHQEAFSFVVVFMFFEEQGNI